MKATFTHNALREPQSWTPLYSSFCKVSCSFFLVYLLSCSFLLFLLSCSPLLLFLLPSCSFLLLFLVLSPRGGGSVSIIDDVFRVWSRRTEVLVRENLVEDGLGLKQMLMLIS